MGVNETDHRFLGLEVEEVSLVDFPANEENWLVIKRGGKQMQEKENANVEALTPPQIEETQETVEKSVESKGEVKVEKSEEVKAEVETEKAVNPAQAMGMLQKIYDMLESAMKKDSKKAEKPEEKKETKKSILGLSEDGELTINAELLQDIQKAKAFTGKRVNVLTDAVKAMLAVLHEVAPDSVKKIVEGAPSHNIKPTTKAVDPEPEEVKEETVEKAETPDLVKEFSVMVEKAINPIAEKIQALESARGEPKSNDGDQTADIKKRNENIWAGLL